MSPETTRQFDFGDVVWVDAPYADAVQSKKRPTVIISNHAFNRISRDILLMTLTTQIKHQHLPGRLVIDHSVAGLEKPSMTKPVLFTLEKDMISSKAGRLKRQDRQMLQQTLFNILKDGN